MEADLIGIKCHEFIHNNPQCGTQVKSIQILSLMLLIPRSLTSDGWSPLGRILIVSHSFILNNGFNGALVRK